MSVEGERNLHRQELLKIVLAMGVVVLAGLMAPEGNKTMAMFAAIALVLAVGWWKG